jgi:hypothetical protein
MDGTSRVPDRSGPGDHGPQAYAIQHRRTYRFFFLCRFFRKRFLRLCVAILCRFLFLPQGMIPLCYLVFNS